MSYVFWSCLSHGYRLVFCFLHVPCSCLMWKVLPALWRRGWQMRIDCVWHVELVIWYHHCRFPSHEPFHYAEQPIREIFHIGAMSIQHVQSANNNDRKKSDSADGTLQTVKKGVTDVPTDNCWFNRLGLTRPSTALKSYDMFNEHVSRFVLYWPVM